MIIHIRKIPNWSWGIHVEGNNSLFKEINEEIDLTIKYDSVYLEISFFLRK